MTSREYVLTHYQILLGQDADTPGLQYWVRFIEDSGNPIDVLAGILNREEYRHRSGHGTTEDQRDMVAALTAHLAPGRSLTIVEGGQQTEAPSDSRSVNISAIGATQELVDF